MSATPAIQSSTRPSPQAENKAKTAPTFPKCQAALGGLAASSVLIGTISVVVGAILFATASIAVPVIAIQAVLIAGAALLLLGSVMTIAYVVMSQKQRTLQDKKILLIEQKNTQQSQLNAQIQDLTTQLQTANTQKEEGDKELKSIQEKHQAELDKKQKEFRGLEINKNTLERKLKLTSGVESRLEKYKQVETNAITEAKQMILDLEEKERQAIQEMQDLIDENKELREELKKCDEIFLKVKEEIEKDKLPQQLVVRLNTYGTPNPKITPFSQSASRPSRPSLLDITNDK